MAAVILVSWASGTAYGAAQVTGSQIAKGAVASKQVKDGSLATTDFATAARGAAGSQGPGGARGAAGAAGSASTTAGPMGPVGNAGATGATGPQGVAGAQGPTGPVGAKGPVGNTGATGPVGPTGPQGNSAADGTVGLVLMKYSSFYSGLMVDDGLLPACPSDKMVLGVQIDGSINQDVFTILNMKYVETNASGAADSGQCAAAQRLGERPGHHPRPALRLSASLGAAARAPRRGRRTRPPRAARSRTTRGRGPRATA